ncbi:DUF4238 domain-containing protein [Paenibacillus periandrae]|uniref:DUF4238 domain-containing protein n=1 Tax=Paenibacillus periandrae TaxID=1761741 RepID=UPI001F090FA7|nr:DUF4238 domain-containing protein [Paenibacillus periandrae]
MSKVTNQHYVPQNYLMNFTNSKGHLYVFDKTTKKSPFPTSPRNVASERYFYDIDPEVLEHIPDDFDEQFIEKNFSKMEGELNNLIKNIKLRYSMGMNSLYQSAIVTDEERVSFSIQISMQMLRTADFRNFIINTQKTLRQTMIDLIGVSEIEGYQPGDVMTQLDPKFETIEHLRFMFNQPYLDSLKLGLVENFIWIIGVNQTDQPFFTSDNPVVRNSHAKENEARSYQGVFSPGMEIVYPLTSKLILTLFERRSFANISKWDNCFIPLTDVENVTYYNSLQVLQSSKQIYCQEDKFELIQQMIKKEPNILKKREHELISNSPLLQQRRRRKRK